MTFKAKLQIEHPEYIDAESDGGCVGCPYEYGYEHEPDRPCLDSGYVCNECWNREMPSTKSVEKNEEKPDMVNHPAHYKSETGLETIDVIEAFTFDLKGIEATDTGNVLKYMCRWKGKNGLEDLKKARWYLNHLINHVEKLKEENQL